MALNIRLWISDCGCWNRKSYTAARDFRTTTSSTGLRREALSESGAGATLWKRCVSADTYGAGAGESERAMRCEAAAELPADRLGEDTGGQLRFA